MFDLKKYKERIAVISDKGEQLTYGELDNQAAKFADAVKDKGLLICLCENRVGSLVGFVGCLEHHIPIVLLDGGKDPGRLDV